ncbi:hypothetical protein [Catenuloplanes indicus]|uniref:Uncharacterized protein n=1 Tax=Catenuloplanes indicus TaxID=137267 RepID=A0AAE3VVN1_9ACTN|nr:hypothetical protein [Catenuloplanes indicus]MDQ0364057.1 hypothetical protein [Catenuloplanes indicus]
MRDWFNTAGAGGGMRQGELALVVGFAAVVAVCATLAGCVSAAVVWREPADGWRGLRPDRPGYPAAGALIVLGLPVALVTGPHVSPLTMMGQVALLYSVPWGAAVAAGGWLGRPERIAALAAALLSAALVAAEFGVRGPGVAY